MPTTSAVILVAGVGSRLRPLTDERPKALLEVGGESLLLRAARLLRGYGVQRLVLATGYRQDAVKRALGNAGLEVHFCYNGAYERTQNAVSLALCREALGDTAFFKLDGDVFFEPEVLERLDTSPAALAVAVDSSRQADAEAMKVRTSETGEILAFGKALPGSEGVCETLGIERVAQGACAALFDALGAALEAGEHDLYYEDVYSRLVGARAFEAVAVEVGDLAWEEIDDLSDLERAEQLASGATE